MIEVNVDSSKQKPAGLMIRKKQHCYSEWCVRNKMAVQDTKRLKNSEMKHEHDASASSKMSGEEKKQINHISDYKKRSIFSGIINNPIKYSLDSIHVNGNLVSLYGWAFDTKSGKAIEDIVLLDDSADCGVLNFIVRNDIASYFQLESGKNIGFSFSFQCNSKENKYASLLMVSDGHYRKIRIDLTDRHKNKHLLESLIYKTWIFRNEKRYSKDKINAMMRQWRYTPKISIVVPVYNIEEEYLRAFIQSVQNQWYTNWELCIADDCSTLPHVKAVLEEYMHSDNRINVVFRKENGHISKATNSALEIATGDFISFMDNDDLLSERTLFSYVRLINDYPDTEFIYCDEDCIDEAGRRFRRIPKTLWDEKLLLGCNYITHFVMVKKTLADKIGLLNPELNGSQDFDYILRATEQARKVGYIQQVLYHWRTIEGSVAENPQAKEYAYLAGKKAVENALARRQIKGKVSVGEDFGTYRIDYLMGQEPGVSIICFNSEGKAVSKSKIDFITRMTEYHHYEVIVINGEQENNSDHRIKYCQIQKASVSSMKNAGLKYADNDIIVYLDENIMPENGRWLYELVNEGISEGTGVVGGKLLDKNKKTWGCGIEINQENRSIAYSQCGKPHTDIGNCYRLSLPHYAFAVDAGFMLVSKKLLQAVNGFSDYPSEICSAIDFCMKIRQKGKKIVWTPYAAAVWEESVYREKTDGFDVLYQQWGTSLFC